MQNSVSVIIPTWNRATTIVAAIQSALQQTIPPAEILVCDDGSTDNTEKLVKELSHPNIIWVAKGRGGRPAIPRNHGIRQAQGEWLAFLDSDDTWQPTKLETQLNAMQKAGTLASTTNASRIAPSGENLGPLLSLPNQTEKLNFDSLRRGNSVITSSTIVHRSIIEKTGGFPEAPQLIAVEDYALWLRVATITEFSYLSQTLINYLDDAQNSVRNQQNKNFWQQRQNIFSNYLGWQLAHPTTLSKSTLLAISSWYQANKNYRLNIT